MAKLSIRYLCAGLVLLAACSPGPGELSSPAEDAGGPPPEAAEGPAGDPAPPRAAPSATYQPATARALTVEAVAACRDGDFPRGRELLRQAAGHRPGQVEIWMLLAGVEHRLGDFEAAEHALARIVAAGLEPPFERAPFYDTLIDEPLHAAALEALAAETAPRQVAEPLFRLEDRGLVPEGVAHDPVTGDFFISSVHRGNIVRFRDGQARRLVADGSLWSVLGLAVDAERRLLWATTAALPQLEHYDPSEEGRSALLAFRLASTPAGEAKPWKQIELELGRPHTLNDLALARDGTVFVTDNRVPGQVYRHGPQHAGLRPLLRAGFFRSPQGIVLSSDERRLYVADYSLGLTVLELDGRLEMVGEARYLEPPPDVCLTGIDGLAGAGVDAQGRDVLIAIQNLYPPHRVLRLELEPGVGRVAAVTVLEQARPDYSEPTLGTVVGDSFVYVANSQWNRFDEAARLPPAAELERPLLLRLPL